VRSEVEKKVDTIVGLYVELYRVHRVPGFLSSRPKWLPRPLTRKLVLPPRPLPSGGRGVGWHIRLREGGGGANSDEGTDNLVLW
jgi:hypothetical protein